MRKIFYFSGVHGIGKSTIIKELAENYIPSATILDFDQFYLYPKDYMENQIYRITNYYKTIKNTNASLILIDRSPFDVIMYSEALHKFESLSGMTKGHLQSIYNVFKMIPSNFYSDSYIIFLNLSLKRTLKNIQSRKRESSEVMFNPYFVEYLYNSFNKFYNQIKKIMNVSIFTDNNEKSYTGIDIVKELQRKCWLQPYEVDISCRLSYEN